jgi:AraC family transcriptional regulator
VILREMPAIWDDTFRPWFYSRWGRENCIIAARTRHAEYPMFEQRLSIKAIWGGREEYFVDGRRIAVDDETFVILNDGRSYASRLRNRTPATSFSIFFRPGMAQDVARTMASSEESLLDDPDGAAHTPIEFSEQVRRHDRQITPVLRFIHRHAARGVTDEGWYEEQLYFLMQRLLALRSRDRRATEGIPATRPSTRRELFRRVGLGIDFINTHFAEPIGLKEIATASLLAPCHCLRIFKSVRGETPTAYLNERRVQAAVRLLRNSETPVDDVAALVGFQSRSTLFRHMKRARGVAPSDIRRTKANDT